MGRTSRALAAGSFASLVALVAAGCSLLMGGGFGAFPMDPELAPSPIATYSEGSATIEIAGGDTIELVDVDPTSMLDGMFGADVHWSNADGWHLRVSGAGADIEGGMFEHLAYITIDRIQEGSGFGVAGEYVVTNAHVVAGVDAPRVGMSPDATYEAITVLFDPDLDLAVAVHDLGPDLGLVVGGDVGPGGVEGGGLDAWIGEGTLSLGEAQRLALARAALSPAPNPSTTAASEGARVRHITRFSAAL